MGTSPRRFFLPERKREALERSKELIKHCYKITIVMQNITDTAAPETAIIAAPLVEAGKKQYTVGSSYESKTAIAELCLEFERPGSNKKTVKMSEKEAIECLFQVATDRRFVTVPVMESIEIDGETCEVQSIDEDGNLVFETKDLIAQAWEGIVSRDYPTIGSKKITTVDDARKQIMHLAKVLNLSEERIQELLESSKNLDGSAVLA